MRILKVIVSFGMVLVFLIGFAFCAFPIIQNIVSEYQLAQSVQGFYEQLATSVPKINGVTEATDAAVQETTVPREHEALWEEMLAYNRQIWKEKQSGLCDSWSYQQPAFTLGDYGLEDEVFGVISIPAIDLEMPLYLGATSSRLTKGAAQLSQTSLPIGGMNTNCVIAGHRGFNGAIYFRYVTDLKPGDEVIITNLWETLTYTVTETQVILPNEVDQILIQEGRDMITLLTCHPYASGGKQRYLVMCERTM